MRKAATVIVTFILAISIYHLLDEYESFAWGMEPPSRGIWDLTMYMNISQASIASFIGEGEDDQSGLSVSGAGDVNGDGYDDILIGANWNSEGGNGNGQTYLFFGKASGWENDLDLSNADASFIGEVDGDNSGRSTACAGDVNGDGYDDIIIGANWNDEGAGFSGQVYLILGKPSGWKMDTDLAISDASFIGEYSWDLSGTTISGAGDVNGDGYDDILIGAHGNGEGGGFAGQTYLILGKPSGWKMDIDLSNSNASFNGENADDYSGSSVSGAGDVNGDGYDDILIGAYRNSEGGLNAGQTYLILGKPSGWKMDIDLSNANASFNGENADDYSGSSVSGAGDVNGDGYDDILIGAYRNSEGGTNAGQTYLILGKPSGWKMDIDLSNTDASFIGESETDRSGVSVSGAGDVNGDGYDDILIGANWNDVGGDLAGQTYLIYGKVIGWTMGISLSNADASFIGEGDTDGSGYSVSGAGDVNGDGYSNLIIGAYSNGEGGINAGKTYLIGFRYTEPLEVYSFEVYTSPYSNPGRTFDIGDSIYMELTGLDGNASHQDAAIVNITFQNSPFQIVRVCLIETGFNTGIYQGQFILPHSTAYLDTPHIEPRVDASYAIDILIDYPSRPTSIDSVMIYSNEGLSATTDILDYGETAYFAITGNDANSILKDIAFLNLSSDKDLNFHELIICQETGINTGVYLGRFTVSDSMIWFENITATSARDPTKNDMFKVHTPVQIRPFFDNITTNEDVEYREKYWNFGWVMDPIWTLTTNRDWLEFDQDTLELHGTPDNGDVGITTVELNLTDTGSHSSSHVFEIMVNNIDPILDGVDITEIDQGEYYEADYNCDDEGQGNTSYHLTSTIDWLSIDPVTGMLSGTPGNDHIGTSSIIISVNDGNDGWDNRSITITVNNMNDAPIITTEDTLSIYQNTPFSKDYEAEDIDIDDEIRWELNTNANFLSIDEEIGALSGIPTALDVGYFFVNISVWDLSDAYDFHNFTLEVINLNDEPIWTEYPIDSEIIHGEIFHFDVNVTDYDGDTISYSISSIPESDILIDENSGMIEWTADIHTFEKAPFILEIRVSAWDRLAYNNYTFNITVIPTGSPISDIIEPADGGKGSPTGTTLRWEVSDPEGDQITYDIYLAQSKAFIQALREEARIRTEFDGDNFTITNLDPGITYFWTVIPYDGCTYGTCDDGILSFMANNPPTVMGIQNEVIKAGDNFEIKVKGSDLNPEDRSNLKYWLVQSPDGMVIDEETGTIIWKPGGDQVGKYTVIFEVSDGVDTVQGSFEIRVNEAENESNLGMILMILGICILVMAVIVIVIILIFLRKRQQVEEAEEEVETLMSDGDLDVDEEGHDTAMGESYQDVPVDSTEAYKNIQQPDHDLSHDDLYGTPAPVLEE